jgi:MFS family permease
VTAAVRALKLVLTDPRLRRLELAFAAFKATESGAWLAILVYAYDLGGAGAAALAALAQLLPAALIAPVAGALADRRGAGRVLAVGYALQASAAAATALALLTGQPPVVVLGAAVGLASCLTVTRPAQFVLMAELARDAEQLTAANVLTGWIESLGMLVAPLAAGVLLTLDGPGLVFAVMATLLAAGCAAIRPLRDVTAPGEEAGELRRAAAALRLIVEHRDTRLLVLLVASTFAAIGALDVLYVVLAVDVLDLGGPGAGYLNAAFGAGGVLALAATARLVGRRVAPSLSAGAAAWTLALLALCHAPGLWSALVLLALAGVGRSLLDVGGRVLLQRVVAPTRMASVGGALEGISMAGLAGGSLLVPVLLAAGGTTVALAGVAALPAVVALAGLRRLATIDERAPVPVGAARRGPAHPRPRLSLR